MKMLVTKLVVTCLAGAIGMPAGFCCEGPIKSDGQVERATGCCHSSSSPTQHPVKVAKTCCCQARANTAPEMKLVKRVSATVPRTALPTPEPRHAAIWRPRSHAFYETGEHSLQTLFCVWQC